MSVTGCVRVWAGVIDCNVLCDTLRYTKYVNTVQKILYMYTVRLAGGHTITHVSEDLIIFIHTMK
jgi:hypothetical protein